MFIKYWCTGHKNSIFRLQLSFFSLFHFFFLLFMYMYGYNDSNVFDIFIILLYVYSKRSIFNIFEFWIRFMYANACVCVCVCVSSYKQMKNKEEWKCRMFYMLFSLNHFVFFFGSFSSASTPHILFSFFLNKIVICWIRSSCEYIYIKKIEEYPRLLTMLTLSQNELCSSLA